MSAEKKIGVLALDYPTAGDYETIGRILSSKFRLELIGGGSHPDKIKQLYALKNYSSVNPTNDLKLFFRDISNLLHYCKREKPDIIMSMQRPNVQGIVVALMGALFKVRTVVRLSMYTFENYKTERGWRKIYSYVRYNWMGRLVFLADKVICFTEEQRQKLIAYGCQKAKVEILPTPTDQTVFFPAASKKDAIRNKLGLPLGKTIALYVGSLQKRKGMESFLEVIPMVTQQRKDVLFVFVGNDRHGYGQQIKAVGKGAVTMVGPINKEKVAEYYQCADLLIHPAHIEGFPRTVLEAAACGLSVVGRNIYGMSTFADKVFDTDEEMLHILMCWHPNSRTISKLPKAYEGEFLGSRYLQVFGSLCH